MNTILANLTVSVSELEHNFMDILEQADNAPVAMLNVKDHRAQSIPVHQLVGLFQYSRSVLISFIHCSIESNSIESPSSRL